MPSRSPGTAPTSTPGSASWGAGSTSASPTATPPRSPPGGCRTGSTPGRGSTGCRRSRGSTRSCRTVCWRSIADQLDHVATNLTPQRNHRTLELYALLVVALGLPVLDPDGDRAARAWAELRENLLTDVWSDGVHCERSTHYHLIALRSFLGARINVTRFGGSVPPEYDDRLRAALRFGMHVHRPDGQIPALSDSDSGSYLDLLELAAQCLDLPDLHYAATQGRTWHTSVGDGGGVPGRRLLRAAQRLGGARAVGRRALPRPRLRPPGRRRARPLRRAVASRPTATAVPWSSTPAATPTPRATRTGGTGSRARPRTTPSPSTGWTSSPTGAASPRARS